MEWIRWQWNAWTQPGSKIPNAPSSCLSVNLSTATVPESASCPHIRARSANADLEAYTAGRILIDKGSRQKADASAEQQFVAYYKGIEWQRSYGKRPFDYDD